MEMNFTIVCTTPSFITKAVTFFLLFYPLVLWGLSESRRNGAGPMAASVVPAALTPLFVAIGAASVGYASLLRGLVITHNGRAVRAAAVAETLTMIAFGCVVSAVVCAISWLRDQFRSNARTESTPPTTRSVRMMSLVLVTLVVALLVAHFVATSRVVETVTTPESESAAPLIFAAIAGVGGAFSFIWLVLSRRNPALQVHRNRRIIAAMAAVVALGIAYWSWQRAEALRYSVISRTTRLGLPAATAPAGMSFSLAVQNWQA
jgi:hypothetical protein